MLAIDQIEKVQIERAKSNLRQGKLSAPESEAPPSNHLLYSLKLACERLLGQSVVEIRAPGGSVRRTVRMKLLDGRTVMVSRRESVQRAKLEERVLHHLGSLGAPVPAILGFNGIVLVQEDLGTLRLAERLADASPTEATRLLERAAEGLVSVHRAAGTARIDRCVPMLGCDEAWVQNLLKQPAKLGAYLGVVPPRPDLDQLFDLFTVADPRFVKWDARPGNAIARPDGSVAWFDWENCGARNRLDDLVWLLADETVPDLGLEESGFVASLIDHFADGRDLRSASRYLYTFGTFHMSVRLALILARQSTKGWQPADVVIGQDEVGANRDLATRLCLRASRWADRSATTRPLAAWFRTIREKIAGLS